MNVTVSTNQNKRPASYDSILHAAAEVFGRAGLADTTVEDLLAEAGVSRRTFYKSFANKEAVLAALYTAQADVLMKALEGARVVGDPLRMLDRGLGAYLEYHVQAGGLLRVMIEEAGRSGSLLADRRKQFRGELLAYLEHALGIELDRWLFLGILAGLEGISLQLLAIDDITNKDLRRAKSAARTLVQRVLQPELHPELD